MITCSVSEVEAVALILLLLRRAPHLWRGEGQRKRCSSGSDGPELQWWRSMKRKMETSFCCLKGRLGNGFRLDRSSSPYMLEQNVGGGLEAPPPFFRNLLAWAAMVAAAPAAVDTGSPTLCDVLRSAMCSAPLLFPSYEIESQAPLPLPFSVVPSLKPRHRASRQWCVALLCLAPCSSQPFFSGVSLYRSPSHSLCLQPKLLPATAHCRRSLSASTESGFDFAQLMFPLLR
ncbi:hypothetical protein PIB30_065081 [Stylosanthes scabra]|uniref:Uncharacterized protein n=1 Tax=Stylosanthes scabra TaxID=79078 RepID=A0ABU6RMS6_9FABA|nr:hypothetical protein [Stylosanthes scabra]